MASRNSLRSSAMSMAAALAPIISTPNFASTPCLSSAQGRVERRLPAHGRQQRVGPLLLDDLGDDLGRDRLDVGRIRQLRIRHDGGRIGIDEDDAVALGLQRLAGLGAGIVELAGLADDDGAGADDEDGLDIRALRHEAASYCSAAGLAIGPARRQLRELAHLRLFPCRIFCAWVGSLLPRREQDVVRRRGAIGPAGRHRRDPSVLPVLHLQQHRPRRSLRAGASCAYTRARRDRCGTWPLPASRKAAPMLLRRLDQPRAHVRIDVALRQAHRANAEAGTHSAVRRFQLRGQRPRGGSGMAAGEVPAAAVSAGARSPASPRASARVRSRAALPGRIGSFAHNAASNSGSKNSPAGQPLFPSRARRNRSGAPPQRRGCGRPSRRNDRVAPAGWCGCARTRRQGAARASPTTAQRAATGCRRGPR